MNIEKNQEILHYFGKTLNEQRTIISKLDLADFAKLINQTSNILFTEEILKKMENGDGFISINYWIIIWTYYQNIDKIKKAYDPKEMLYLAQQEIFPDIEQEILKNNEKTR
jgi:hypothetical protein